MRYFSYNKFDPSKKIPSVIVVSEEDIINQYYSHWYVKMCCNFGKENVDGKYTYNHCIEDWMALHWAKEIFDYVK